MDKNDPRLIVALDGLDEFEAMQIAASLSGLQGLWGVKFNSLLRQQGYHYIGQFGDDEFGLNVFADMKLHDIPSVVARDCDLMKPHKPGIVTVHCSGGVAMMQEALKALGPEIIAGVTVLTSLGIRETQRIYAAGAVDAVIDLVLLGAESGMQQFVCSAQEARVLKQYDWADHDKKLAGWTPTLICPGITPEWAAKPEDQARVMTPGKAIEFGADLLVVGRAITKPPEGVTPRQAAERVITEINAALSLA